MGYFKNDVKFGIFMQKTCQKPVLVHECNDMVDANKRLASVVKKNKECGKYTSQVSDDAVIVEDIAFFVKEAA